MTDFHVAMVFAAYWSICKQNCRAGPLTCSTLPHIQIR